MALWLTIVVSLTLSRLFGVSLTDILASVLMLLCIYTIPMRLEPELRAQAFHPWAFYVMNNIFQYGLPALLVLFSSVEESYMEYYSPSVLLIGLAFLTFCLGWRGPVGRILSEKVPLLVFPKRRGLDGTFWPTVLFLYAAGWAGRVARAAAGFSHLPNEDVNWQSGSIWGIVSTFATLSFVVILYQLMRARRKSVTNYALTGGIILLEIAGGGIEGGRSAIVVPLLYSLMVYHFAVRHIRWRTILMGYVVAFLALAPLLTWYRTSYYKELETQKPGVGAAISVLTAREVDQNVYGGWLPTLRENVFESRTAIFRSTLRVLGTVPEVYPYQCGDTFVTPLTTLIIPRAVWPDKPIYTPGRDFAVRFWNIDPDRVLGTSVPLGMPGEAYYNFGWLGLLMFPLLGVMLRFTYERYLQYSQLESFPVIRVFFILLSVGNSDNAFLYYFAEIARGGAIYLTFLMLVNWQFPELRRPLKLREGGGDRDRGKRPRPRRIGWAGAAAGPGPVAGPQPARLDA